MSAKRHRAEVIEVYDQGARAAVRFRWRGRDRIECVIRRGMVPLFTVGAKGWASYQRCLGGFEWTFTPFKAG